MTIYQFLTHVHRNINIWLPSDCVQRWLLWCVESRARTVVARTAIFIVAKASQSNAHIALQQFHYNDVIMGSMVSQITSLTISCRTVYSGADQRKHQSSASLAFVWGIHRWPVKFPHKGPITRKMLPFDDVIMFESRQLVGFCFFSTFVMLQLFQGTHGAKTTIVSCQKDVATLCYWRNNDVIIASCVQWNKRKCP